MLQINTAVIGAATTANDSLADFITKSKTRLNAILERLQWSEQNVLKQFNTNSKTALRHAAEETENETAAENDKDVEPPLPPSYDSKISIVIAQNELQELLSDASAQIPAKFSDSQVQFTREQRLRLYEYVLERTGRCTEPELQVPALNDGQTTFAEIVAQKRREKKNRRRHRTTKPTHVEEVRGLVDLQMQALQQYVEARTQDDRKNEKKRQEKQIRSRRSRSRESIRDQHCRRIRSKSREADRRKRSKSRDADRRKRSKSRSPRKHRKRSRSDSRHRQKRERSRETRDNRKRRSRSRERERHRSAKRKEDSLENSRKRLEPSPSYRKEHKSSRSRRSRSRSGSCTNRRN